MAIKDELESYVSHSRALSDAAHSLTTALSALNGIKSSMLVDGLIEGGLTRWEAEGTAKAIANINRDLHEVSQPLGMAVNDCCDLRDQLLRALDLIHSVKRFTSPPH